jgi:sortase A
MEGSQAGTSPGEVVRDGLASPPSETAPGRPRAATRRLARWLGNLLVAGGVVLLVWAGWTWQWGDPVTGVYTALQQRRLDGRFDAVTREFDASRPAVRVRAGTVASRQTVLATVAASARRFRSQVAPGEPIGRLAIPRLGLSVMLVNGTGTEELKRGPGRDARSRMPGERELVYVAGHRTTYGAPFANIDRLERGDRVTVTLPYAKVTYVVTAHRVVPATALSELDPTGREILRLQACHPRFFATERYIVDAVPSRITLRGGDLDGRVVRLS